MAMILVDGDGNYVSTCALCDKVLSDPIFATTHFIEDLNHHLYQYSDAGIHWDCYAKWEFQEEFASLYFEAVRGSPRDRRFWRVLAESGDIYVEYGTALGEVGVLLRMSGTEDSVPRDRWPEWLDGGYLKDSPHPLHRAAVENALPFLRSVRLPEAG
ncbi:MAG TPA: hypothetical protein VMZ92_09120 [Planctomycetota bacterium]|nr:hypothetical protein [Planctomycetota bacterium]